MNSLDSYYSFGSGTTYTAKTKDQLFNLDAAEGEKNNIVVSRRKNGVTFENEIYQVFIPANNSIELTFDY